MRRLIPEPHAGYARRVCELVESDSMSLRDRISRKAKLSDAYATRLIEDPSIICVAGERGSGKTTVLATAAAQMAAAGHVVIPPVRPEYFAAPTSLLPTVVAHLQTMLRADLTNKRAGLAQTASIELQTVTERTLQQANLASYEMADASPLRADEQAADRSLAASADANFIDHWQRLIAQVRELAATRSEGAADPLVVIPVDDPDLSPGTLRQILLDLRLLTSVDGVVGVACLDLDEARFVLADAYARTYASTPGPLLRARVVEAQIAKAFPDDRKVEIRGLDGDRKLAFKALDLPLPSLERILKAHPIGGARGGDTLASVLRMPTTRSPSFYATALPSNPRDLRGLAYRLSSIAGGSAGDAAMELCRTAINTGLKESGATDPETWPSGLPFEELAPVAGIPTCALRFDDVRFSSISPANRLIPDNNSDSGLKVSVSYEAGVEGRLVERGRDPQPPRRLHPSLTYALLLVREMQESYAVIQCNVSGVRPIRGGEDTRSTYLSVRFDNHESDHRFLNAPAWEAHYDYFLLDEAVSKLIPIACAPHRLPDRRLAIEAYTIDFCREIVAIQAGRRPARASGRVSRRIREGNARSAGRLIERELVRLFREIGACLDLDARRSGENPVRVSDFKRWAGIAIVSVCHDRLVRPEFMDQLLELRADLLGERLTAADSEVRDVLESRVKAALDEPWVVPLIALVRHFRDAELADALMASHVAAMEAIERGRHRLLGSALIDQRVAASDEPTPAQRPSDFDIALAVLDELEADAGARTQRASA